LGELVLDKGSGVSEAAGTGASASVVIDGKSVSELGGKG
jgi:hypothetical protein